jgi:hypothetical protein
MVSAVQLPLHCLSAAARAAFAAGECARRPRLGDVTRNAQYQRQRKNKERAALRRHGRNNQNPLPRGNGKNLAGGSFKLVNESFVGLGKRRACAVPTNPDRE